MKFGLRHLALIVTTFAALGLNTSALLRQPVAVNQVAHRAALVVRFGDGRVVEQCVAFAEAEITGYDLVRRSTLPVVANQFGGMGAAICKIADEGCDYPAEDCFCKSISEQKSWFFWTLQNGVWTSSNAGASSAKVTEGVVHGWVWGSGSPAVPAKTFDQICTGVSAAPTATAPVFTSTSTSTPTLTPTSTSPPPQPVATATATTAPPASNLVGGGQVISGVIAAPVPTAVQANVPAPVASPVAGVTVVAVVAVLVPTSTPAAVVTVPTAEATLTPTFTPEPTITSTITSTSTFTFTPEPTLTPTFTPEPTLTSTITSTFTITSTSTFTFTPEPTLRPTPTLTPPPPETPPAPNVLGYALFGIIALGLIGGIALTRLRR